MIVLLELLKKEYTFNFYMLWIEHSCSKNLTKPKIVYYLVTIVKTSNKLEVITSYFI